MAKEMSTIDEFLKDRSNEYASGGKYLRKWRENKKVRVWLHTRAPIMKLWRHGGIPRLVTMSDRDTGDQVTKLWPGFWSCAEKEDVLVKQHKRNRETEEREVYPRHCALCRLVETVRTMVVQGELTWTDPVFKFETDDPAAKEPRVVLHAGGLFGMFGWRDLDDHQKAEARKAGINLAKAWSENAYPRTNYLFCVVDHDAPENGVQIAIESSLLGEKVRDVIEDACESLGSREAGDPRKNPYAFMWRYNDAKNLPFNQKYHALRLENLGPTEEVLDLIRGEAPDVSRDVKPFNVLMMRGMLEKHALVKLPWDEIFDVPRADEGEQEDEEPKARPAGRRPPPPAESKPAPVPPRATAARPPKPPPPKEEMVSCDACDKPMAETATKCPHCGEEYDLDPVDKVAPPPAPVAKSGKKPQAAPPPAPSESLFNDADSDEVGF